MKLLRSLLKAATLSLALLAGGASSAAEKAITIGVNNWAENIAVANLWKLLLEGKGRQVKLQNADKAMLYGGVAKGQIDLTFEVWLPHLDEPAFSKVRDNVELIGPWFLEASMGLAVPDYVTVDSIDQLNARKTEFTGGGTPTVYGIEAGSSLMGATDKAKVQYGLEFNVLASSESGMLITLERAIQRKQPIVVTLWKPHWVWSRYKLRYLKDPKGLYGKTDAIHAISSKTFRGEHAEVDRWLRNFRMDDASLGSLMAEIIAQGQSTPAKGTRAWIDANRTTVDAWLR